MHFCLINFEERKKIEADKIITHLKISRRLYIMYNVPVFCRISAAVVDRMLGEAENREILKTDSDVHTHFLIFQIKHMEQNYHQECDLDPQQIRDNILAPGKLAFQELEKNNNPIVYKEDLRECGVDVKEVSVYSEVATQIFRAEFWLHLWKLFSFVHLSIQVSRCFVCFSFLHQQKSKRTTNHSSV